MNQPIIGPNGRPVVTAEMQAQSQIQQMYFSVFFSLVPVIAAEELRRTSETWAGEELDLARITGTAKKIAVAAMKEIGVIIE